MIILKIMGIVVLALVITGVLGFGAIWFGCYAAEYDIEHGYCNGG